MLGRFASLLILLLLTACASTPQEPIRPAEPAVARCFDLYDAFDRTVAEHGGTPSSPAPVEGFPYLRVNRFLASYRDQALSPDARAAWVARMADLDTAVRQVELASLPARLRRMLAASYAEPGGLASTLAKCSQTLKAQDLASPERLALLRERTAVPPDYGTLERVLGVYPITALGVRAGVFRWQEETRHLFSLPLGKLPVQGELQRFSPSEAPGTALPVALPRDALGIPVPGPNQLAALFAAHAPIWEIDVAGNYDRPGAPRWQADGTPTVDPTIPVVYRYRSYTRWQGDVLLQLNYVLWFAERPLTGSFDILGGALDGIIWRVTLDRDGQPLIYDTIHACGCYHLFFPTTALALRPEALSLPEPPLVPQFAPVLFADEQVVIRVGSGNHYIQRVYSQSAHSDAPLGPVYLLRDYRALYATPASEGKRRSLFGPDGLVPGTERAERWLLWPMGIASPGAMRERGRHATAFVGRRHFDDPDLLEGLFETGRTRP